MGYINEIKLLDTILINTLKYSLYLNEVRKNLAGDRPTLFAIFPLIFVPFMQHAG